MSVLQCARQWPRKSVRPTEIYASRDELGGLTKSFADMTQQLADARGLAQHSLGAAEHAKAELQTILDNLTAGVIVFDAEGRIDSVNPGATRILRAPLYDWLGQPLSNIPALAGFAEQIEQRRIQAEANSYGEPERWQDSFELLSEPDHASLTLLVRGAALPADKRLMVIDDISDIVSAQRSVAWAEVARRLAHEIKNPLTPIQLSAERLQHKLSAKLEGADQQMLARSVATIVNQVQAMKQLVNEFRDYSRLPSAKLEPLDLNGLIGEVLALLAWVLAGLAPRRPTGCAANSTPSCPASKGMPANCARSSTTWCKTPWTPRQNATWVSSPCRPSC